MRRWVGGVLRGRARSWDASLVARLGLLIAPDMLIDTLGGIASQNVRIDAVCGSTLNGGCRFDQAESNTHTLIGWTAGASIETMVAPQSLARFDDRCADLGTIDHRFFPTEPIRSPLAAIRIRTHTASSGVAYQFGPRL